MRGWGQGDSAGAKGMALGWVSSSSAMLHAPQFNQISFVTMLLMGKDGIGEL